MPKVAKMAKAVTVKKPKKRPTSGSQPSDIIEHRAKRLRSFLQYSGTKDPVLKKLKEKLKKKYEALRYGDQTGRHKVLLEYEAAVARPNIKSTSGSATSIGVTSTSTGVTYMSRGWGPGKLTDSKTCEMSIPKFPALHVVTRPTIGAEQSILQIATQLSATLLRPMQYSTSKNFFIGNGLMVPLRPYVMIYTENMCTTELRKRNGFGSDVFVLGNSTSNSGTSGSQPEDAIFPYCSQFLWMESRMFNPGHLLQRPKLPGSHLWQERPCLVGCLCRRGSYRCRLKKNQTNFELSPTNKILRSSFEIFFGDFLWRLF